MNNTISPVNNVNFQAKLNTAHIRGNKARWKNIAEIFEGKTKQFTNDEIILSGSVGKGFNLMRKNIQKNWIENDAIIQPVLIKALYQLSDNEIAQKLATILKFMSKESKIEEKIRGLDKFIKLDNSQYDEAFYDLMAEIHSERIKNFQEQNPIFKEGLII